MKTKNLKFRVGTMDDMAQLKALAFSSYVEYEHVLTKENWHRLKGNLESENAHTALLQMATCFVCECENEIVGVAYFVPKGNPTPVFEAAWSYIRMVGVHPKYRGNGISKRLTQNCIDYARRSGESIIALHTSEFMDAARSIYERLGFKKIKEIEPIFGKRYWLYKLELSQ